MSDITLDSYNSSAKELAEYFKGIGSRVDDIELALKLTGKTDGTAKVLELGCGDGRDSKEIIKRVKDYKGIDYSEELIKIAKKFASDAEFEVRNIKDFEYPKNQYDVIFAFASLLHVSIEDLTILFKSIAESLRPGGVFYVSLKFADKYKEDWKEDRFGKRLFYFYNPTILKQINGNLMDVVYENNSRIGHTEWFEMALKKK